MHPSVHGATLPAFPVVEPVPVSSLTWVGPAATAAASRGVGPCSEGPWRVPNKARIRMRALDPRSPEASCASDIALCRWRGTLPEGVGKNKGKMGPDCAETVEFAGFLWKLTEKWEGIP